jgi:epsin
LIQDEERLRAERQDRRSWKSRVTGLDEHGPPPQQQDRPRRERRRGDDDDDQMRKAIEASKSEAEAEELRRRRAAQNDDEDAALAKALKLSKEEEELRRKELEEANANLLFDDPPSQQPAVSQPTGWNGGYQQQPTVDWFGNVIDPNQPQQTGFGMQGQPTGYQNGFNSNAYGFQQPQQTGFGGSPFGQPQNNFIQPQQTAFQSNNPYGQQPNGFGQNGFGQQDQSQLQPQDPAQASGSNNPWASNNQQTALQPLPTGSNNPFGNTFNRPQSTNTNRLQPTLNSLSEQKATTAFNPISNYQAPQQPIQRPSSQPSQQPEIPNDPHKARLNALLASGEGQDTFGNVGDLRIPSQHTAPGVFVNSAGANAQRLTSQATGNPFLQSQFTGMPTQTGFGSQQYPAQTGPAGGFGASGYGGGNNPFGAQQGRPGQQQGGGSLIDL